jgi:hypothetical protein
LKGSPKHLQSMVDAHLSYGRERWNLLSSLDIEKVCQRGWENSISEKRGIAGIARPNAVKCLHTHLAHYLSGEHKNVVGKWTMEALEREFDLQMNNFVDAKSDTSVN